jgi:hypothetical protein
MVDSMIERMAMTLEIQLNGYRTEDLILIESRQSAESLRNAARVILGVMREPSHEMLSAGEVSVEISDADGRRAARIVYSAMIEAAAGEADGRERG